MMMKQADCGAECDLVCGARLVELPPPPRLLILRKRRVESTDFSSFSSYAQGNEDEARIHGEPRKADMDGRKVHSTCHSMVALRSLETHAAWAPNQSLPHTQAGPRAHSPPPRELNPAESPATQVAHSRCRRWAQALGISVCQSGSG